MHQSNHAEICTLQGQVCSTRCFPIFVCTRRQRVVSQKCFHLLATRCVVSERLLTHAAIFGLALLTKPHTRQPFLGWPEACGLTLVISTVTGNQDSTCQIGFCARIIVQQGMHFQNFQRRRKVEVTLGTQPLLWCLILFPRASDRWVLPNSGGL